MGRRKNKKKTKIKKRIKFLGGIVGSIIMASIPIFSAIPDSMKENGVLGLLEYKVKLDYKNVPNNTDVNKNIVLKNTQKLRNATITVQGQVIVRVGDTIVQRFIIDEMYDQYKWSVINTKDIKISPAICEAADKCQEEIEGYLKEDFKDEMDKDEISIEKAGLLYLNMESRFRDENISVYYLMEYEKPSLIELNQQTARVEAKGIYVSESLLANEERWKLILDNMKKEVKKEIENI